jgi:hypothetical protein
MGGYQMVAHKLGEAWSDELSQPYREALHSAFVELVDNYFTVEDRQDNLIADGMPPKYRHRYDELFLRRFFATFLTVGYKLALREPPAPLLSCTAEELACAIIIGLAEVHLEEKGIKADFGGFEEEIYQDTDFKFLYRPDMDGIEDSPEFSHLGIGPLRLDEWFEPFLNATTPVHPYSVD